MKLQNRIIDILENVAAENKLSFDEVKRMYAAPYRLQARKIRDINVPPEKRRVMNFPFFVVKHLGTFEVTEQRLKNNNKPNLKENGK